MRSVRQALSIARKDLAIEFRTKESLNGAGAFAVVILLLFSFAFDPASDVTREIGGGLLWIVFAFAFIWRIASGRFGKPIVICAFLTVLLSAQSLFTNAFMLFALGSH